MGLAAHLDLSHHGTIGWPDNPRPTLDLLARRATAGAARPTGSSTPSGGPRRANSFGTGPGTQTIDKSKYDT